MDGEATDEELLARIVEADQQALRALMARYARKSIALAERIVGGNVEADDVSQEAFIRVWRNAARFDGRRGQFSTWFFRIVVNLAIDRARRGARNRPLEAAGDVADGQKSAVAKLIEDDQDRTLSAALALLPDRQRAAIALFHLEGLSGRDAAESLGLSEKAFESLLIRARRGLRTRVADLEKGARA